MNRMGTMQLCRQKKTPNQVLSNNYGQGPGSSLTLLLYTIVMYIYSSRKGKAVDVIVPPTLFPSDPVGGVDGRTEGVHCGSSHSILRHYRSHNRHCQIQLHGGATGHQLQASEIVI